MPESQAMQNAAAAPMYGPDGNVYMVPNSEIPKARAAGGEFAVPMVSPKGDHVWVRGSQMSQGIKAGGKVDWSSVPQTHQEGFWSALGSDLMGYAKGVPGMLHTMGQALSGNPQAVSDAMMTVGSGDQRRQQQGRSGATDLWGAYRFIAPAGDAVGLNTAGMENAANEGDTAGVAGHAAAPIVAMAASEVGARAVPKMVTAAERGALLGKTPEGAYESAMKPSPAKYSAGQRSQMVQTALQEGIPVSKSGLAKLQDLIDDLDAKRDAAIAFDPNRPVSTVNSVRNLDQVRQRFSNQVTPQNDLAQIDAAQADFLNNPKLQPQGAGPGPSSLSAQDAQAMKSGTYRALGDKSFGELKGARVESEKALARGLKDSIAEAFPELKNLNARESKLFDLQGPLEQAVNRISNHQVIGIGTPAATAAAKAVTGSNVAAGAAGFLKAVLDNPGVKSRLAIAISKGGRIPPASAMARIAAVSASLSSGATGLQTPSSGDTSATPATPAP